MCWPSTNMEKRVYSHAIRAGAVIKGNPLLLAAILIAVWSSGCASLHDGKGWEHGGNPSTHQDATPYVFEHKH